MKHDNFNCDSIVNNMENNDTTKVDIIFKKVSDTYDKNGSLNKLSISPEGTNILSHQNNLNSKQQNNVNNSDKNCGPNFRLSRENAIVQKGRVIKAPPGFDTPETEMEPKLSFLQDSVVLKDNFEEIDLRTESDHSIVSKEIVNTDKEKQKMEFFSVLGQITGNYTIKDDGPISEDSFREVGGKDSEMANSKILETKNVLFQESNQSQIDTYHRKTSNFDENFIGKMENVQRDICNPSFTLSDSSEKLSEKMALSDDQKESDIFDYLGKVIEKLTLSDDGITLRNLPSGNFASSDNFRKYGQFSADNNNDGTKIKTKDNFHTELGGCKINVGIQFQISTIISWRTD